MPQRRWSTKDSSACKESQWVQALTKSAGAYIAKRKEGQREDVGRGCMSKGKEVRNSMEYVKSHESWHKAQRKK